jgi:thiol-disulfide isomerase/thioredoxin
MANSTPIAPQPPQNNLVARIRNLIIVLVAVLLSVALFLGLRTDIKSVNLNAIADDSVPLEVALSNNKPTMLEFYANWCTSCQAMASDMAELKQQYGNDINFVMLNVDNSKWLPEILSYRVDGIPHFVFLGKDSNSVGETIGKQPKSVMQSNLVALLAGEALPYAKATGETSAFSAAVAPAKPSISDPRSHSSQVVSQ